MNRGKYKAFGEEKTIRAWSKDERCKCSSMTLIRRIDKGMNIEEAIITPSFKMDSECNHKHPLYQSWQCMKTRCYNPSAPQYLGGNISVYDEWKDDFKKFYDWAINFWNKGLVLTRKDITFNFTPDNCVFVPRGQICSANGIAGGVKLKGKARSNETDAKIRATNLERYGAPTPFECKEILEKAKQTTMKRYGVDNSFDIPGVKEKIKLTCNKKYGTDTPLQSAEIRQKGIDTCINKYGKPYFNETNLKQQNEIKEWLSSIGYEFNSDFSILKNKEIDLYNKQLKLGIEYCGLYWHTEEFGRNRQYHYSKFKECLSQNIRLLTIFSDEWIYRNNQVKGFIISILNKCNNKYYARKCKIKQINKEEGKLFIETYHIQGQKKESLIYFGIYFNDDLMGVMSLNKHHRNNRELVLNRLCFKFDCIIIGGASRLFSFAKIWAKQNDYHKIVSWSDNRWSYGNIYNQLGFVLEKELEPDYSYILLSNPKIRKPKQSMQKGKICCPDGKTELEYTKELGYSRIWDCGKKRWIFNIL